MGGEPAAVTRSWVLCDPVSKIKGHFGCGGKGARVCSGPAAAPSVNQEEPGELCQGLCSCWGHWVLMPRFRAHSTVLEPG